MIYLFEKYPTWGRHLVLCATLALAACHGGAPPEPRSGEPSSQSSAEESFSAAQIQRDLTALYGGLKQAHFDLFTQVSREEYDALYQRTLEGIDRSLSPLQATRLLQKFAAFGKVAHARIDFPSQAFGAYREAGGRTLPFFIKVVDGRVFVSETYSDLPRLERGDEILQLDGEPVDAWLERLGAHLSADTPYLSHVLLELQFPQLFWLERGPADAVTLRLRKADGSEEEVKVDARSRAEIVATAETRPPALELDWSGREHRLLDGDIAYLRPGPFYEATAADPFDPTPFREFLDRAFQDFVAAGARALLIDLRGNPGGDHSFSDPMIAWFADRPFRFFSSFEIRVSSQTTASNQARADLSEDRESLSHAMARLYAEHRDGDVVPFEIPFAEPRPGRRYEGEVYLLVSRHSFSNAVNVAAIVQDYGFGTVLGEETADLATTYGAMEQFTLPETGLKVGYPKARIIRPSGDEAVRGVVPDIVIPTPIVEGAEDPVLLRALEIVRQAAAGPPTG